MANTTLPVSLKRFIFVALCLSLLRIHATVADENWVLEGSTGNANVYVNHFEDFQQLPKGPVIKKKVPGGLPNKLYGLHEPRESDAIRCWIKYVYKASPDGVVYETKMYIEVTRARAVRVLKAIDYDKNGQAVKNRGKSSSSRIVPDSVGSSIYRGSFGDDGQTWWYDEETKRTGTPTEDQYREFEKSRKK